MIQKKLEGIKTGESAFTSALISGMLHFFPKAACNQFGNYLCQRVIEVCTPGELSSVVYAVLSNIMDMALNPHGTRAVQTLIEAVAQAWLKNGALYYELLALVQALDRDAGMLCTNNNGNHVI
jgi:hypothetical protein